MNLSGYTDILPSIRAASAVRSHEDRAPGAAAIGGSITASANKLTFRLRVVNRFTGTVMAVSASRIQQGDGPSVSAPAPQLELASNQDRRRHRRVALALHGRFMLPDRQEHLCRITDMSPGGARLATEVSGRLDDRVVAYIDQIGRIEGKIARILGDGFGMTIEAGSRKREKLAAQLTWLANRSVLGLPEDRRHNRQAPINPNTDVLRTDGSVHPGVIVDMSCSGAAVKCAAPVEIGEPITIGDHRSIVVRKFDNGFAVEFSQKIDIPNTEEIAASLIA
jgi:hypothetical protein